jgi:protein-S-isoprenylcysteine O-methyltransferase Ste14
MVMSNFYEEPFFWALISMFGLVGACAVVGSKAVGGRTTLGLGFVALFDLGRFLLVVPDQSRFDLVPLITVLGGVLFLAGGYLGLAPCFLIRPLNAAEQQTTLITSGFYGIVRNPIYLGELLWCLGWALIYRSIIGVALVPLWWAALLILVVIEEENLERELGQPYRDYKRRVRGRIVPGLPF